jgi:hypothetical protein
LRAPRALLALTAVVALLGLSAPARAGMADRMGATFALMAQDFIQAFQPIEGLIVSTGDALVYTDLGTKAGAQVGQELTVFRKGDQFLHPLTGKPLGRYEQVLGYAQIRSVKAEFSEAVFVPVPGQPRPQPTDGVRITRGRIRMAITPVLDLTDGNADTRRVPYMIATALERSKRFQVVDPLAVNDMFATGGVRVEEVLARPERAVRIAKNLDVTGWLVPMLIERNGITYFDVTWISAITGSALLSRREALLRGSPAEEQRFPWEPRPED